MKDKLNAFIIFLAIAAMPLLSLAGCSEKQSSVQNSAPTYSGNSTNNLSSAGYTESTAKKPADNSSGNTATAPVSLPQVDNWEDFIGADGQPVTLENAAVDGEGSVTLDYCFVKFLPEIYDDTFKNPDFIDWGTMEFAEIDNSYTPEIKRLKAGDVLPNGLTVKEAYRVLMFDEVMDQITCEVRREWCDSFGWVTFDGELTLSGALYCNPEDDYEVFNGELYFFPDTTSGVKMPTQCSIFPGEHRVWESVYPKANFAVRSGAVYYVGNIDDVDLDGILERGKAAEVTVTLGNISIQNADINHGGRGGGCHAEIVSIEKINS